MIESHSPASEPTTMTTSAAKSTFTSARWPGGSWPETAGPM
jgi:hypothetical protein